LKKVPDDVRIGVKRVFSKGMAEKLLKELRAHSPVSPEEKPHYRDQWRVDRTRYTDNTVIAGLRIYNKTPYASAMEYGGIEGGHPWPWYPRRKSGRLTTGGDGRVWAGGLSPSPGHTMTMGGAITKVSEKNRDFRFLAKDIADKILKGWQ